MSLEDNCGKFGRTKMIFFVTLPGGLVLCVPCQYRVFPPLAAIIAASCWGILATRRWRRCTWICPHLSSRAWQSSSRFWGGLCIELIARPNSSQRCSMGLQSGDLGGCSIFVTLPSCRKLRTTLARWGVALSSDSGSCPRNNAWQMVLRCFAKCPYRAQRWDIRQGAQEGIWRYCGKLPIHGPNHHQLGPYEPGTLAGSAHQVNGVP